MICKKIKPILNNFFLQNTYTNAEKLLAAAEELAQTGECNADDIYRWISQNIFIYTLPDMYMHTQIRIHKYTNTYTRENAMQATFTGCVACMQLDFSRVIQIYIHTQIYVLILTDNIYNIQICKIESSTQVTKLSV